MQIRGQRRWVVPQPTPALTRPTYLVDGDCGFCRRAMRRVLARFPGTFDAIPFSEADLSGLGLTMDECRRLGHFVAPRGDSLVISAGSQSWAGVLLEQSGGWRLLGRVMRIPPMKWGADLVYATVAANRGRFPSTWP